MFESKKNNIFFKLWAWLSPIGNLVIIWEGKESLIEDFTDAEPTKSFKWTIVKYKKWVPYQTEVVNAISKNGKNLIVQRAVEKCPMNWTSTELVQNKYQFDEGDIFFMNLTAWDLYKIDEKFSTKLDIYWWIRTWLPINSIIYVNAEGEEDVLEFDPEVDSWKAILIDPLWWLKLESPSVNIWDLEEETIINENDEFILNRPWVWNRKINWNSFIPKVYWWNWSDWDLVISSWTTTLNMTASWNSTWFVEKNYNNLTISWTALLNFWNLQSNWNIAYIKVKWDFTMSWWTINANAMWWLWWSGSNSSWNNGARWKLFDFPVFTDFANAWLWGSTVSNWGAWVYLFPSIFEKNVFAWAWWWEGREGADLSMSYWWDWGRGWWVLILEVWWNFNFTWWVISANWWNWANGWGDNSASWWGGWWGGWCIVVFWKKLISNTWSILVNWWNGGNGMWGTSNSYTSGRGGWWGGSLSAWWNGWSPAQDWANSQTDWVAWTSNSYWTWWLGWVKWWNTYGGWWGGWWGAGFKFIHFNS